MQLSVFIWACLAHVCHGQQWKRSGSGFTSSWEPLKLADIVHSPELPYEGNQTRSAEQLRATDGIKRLEAVAMLLLAFNSIVASRGIFTLQPRLGRLRLQAPSSSSALRAAGAGTDPIIGQLLRSSELPQSMSFTEWRASGDGLSVWRRALAAGRVPDFDGIDADYRPWPQQPLLSALSAVVARQSLPRTTARHPSLIGAALLAVLNAVASYSETVAHSEDISPSDDQEPNSQTNETTDTDEGDDTTDWKEALEQLDQPEHKQPDWKKQRLLRTAKNIAKGFGEDWAEPLRGIRAIESIGGADAGDAGQLTAGEGNGFSLHDALWRHDGWQPFEGAQQKLRELHELTELISQLGQRAATDGVPDKGRAVIADARAAPSAVFSEVSPRELSGLALTGNLARVAPFELALLADKTGISAGKRRKLFLSRLVERQLLGYSLEGWAEDTGRPHPRRPQRLPQSRGGPLVLCLDTSHSMKGGRERLAKAVVLEAVRAAHAQGRACLLFAFSGTSNLATLRLTPSPSRRPRRRRSRRASCAGMTDRESLTKLLDFLAYSFGGGTDVAGPLRRALNILEKPDESEVQYSGADLLLVTDGELPNPPLDDATMAKLQHMKATRGFQVHGLLVAKPRPTPLDLICDEVHTMLSRFDPVAVMRDSMAQRDTASANLILEKRRAARKRFSRARQPVMSETSLKVLSTKPIETLKEEHVEKLDLAQVQKRAAAVHDLVAQHDTLSTSLMKTRRPAARQFSRAQQPVMSTLQEEHVETLDLAQLQKRAKAQVKAQLEKAGRDTDGPDNSAMHSVLQNVTASLEYGLIEREGEARLLVLALIGGEHLLLLGPPGTAKSELCRRLSAIAGLTYFERTLTRFSTPEELFGPLSLSALERDEFKRATAGYAPDAQIVFIDEIFKSNSAILNTLLTLLNERLFDEGSSRREVPLLSAVAASNEGPESDELDALYDRFLLRKAVSPVSDDGILDLLLQPSSTEYGSSAGSQAAFDAGAVKDLLLKVQEIATEVKIPRWVALLLRNARSTVQRGDLGDGVGYVSDRRLRRAADLMKSSAAAHGRGCITVMDALAVLPHVLWDEVEQASDLMEWIEENVIPDAETEQLNFLLESVRSRAASSSAGEDRMLARDAHALSEAALEAAAEMRVHQAAIERAREHLFVPPQQAAGWRQTLLPEASERVRELRKLAEEAVMVELAIEAGIDITEETQAFEDPSEEERVVPELFFTDEEMSWARKEAKAKLEPDEFRAWKKALKKYKAKKKN